MSGAESSAPAFGAWATLYRRFRPAYPAAVFDRLAAVTGGASGLCVELGAGAGQATSDLVQRYARVIAVEPDAAMARLISPEPRLDIRIARAEDVELPAGEAEAVVAAASFHWMDQGVVARRAARWIAPGGVFFAFVMGRVQFPDAPRGVQERVNLEMIRARTYVDERLWSWLPYAEALRQSGAFAATSGFEIYADYVWSPAELAGFLTTMSFAQPLAQASGDREAYLHALTLDLAAAARDRPIPARIPIEGAYGRVGASTS